MRFEEVEGEREMLSQELASGDYYFTPLICILGVGECATLAFFTIYLCLTLVLHLLKCEVLTVTDSVCGTVLHLL